MTNVMWLLFEVVIVSAVFIVVGGLVDCIEGI